MKKLFTALLTMALLSPAGVTEAAPDEIRGWTLLSSNDAGNERTIAAAKDYRINHLQLSHDVIHHLRQLKESEDRRRRAVRLTDQAHAAGIEEVAVWDHALYSLTYYPAEFRTGPGGTIDLDNPAFWEWFKADYRAMLDLLPNVDSVILTFIETGARVERQHSTRLKTAQEKLAYLIDQVASVTDERKKLLYLRTFAYFPEEMQRTISAIDLVKNQGVRVMSKAQPHDFFLTHPVDVTVGQIKRPVLIEYDATGEYNGQGKMAGAFVADHADRLRHYRKLPNVIGYVARGDRFQDSHIVGTPTEVNLWALHRAPRLSNSRIYLEFARRKYGMLAAPRVAQALARSQEIVESVLYTLGNNSGDHSRLNYDPYCPGYHRSVSGKWIDPPVAHVKHGVNKSYHYWIDVVNTLAPPHCKLDPILRNETPYVLDRGWVTPGNLMVKSYLDDVVTEKNHGVRLAEASLRDVEAVKRFLKPPDHAQLKAYFERTVISAKLHRSIAKAYFGYRLYLRIPSAELARTIWEGLDESKLMADAVRTYPAPPGRGEFDWVSDAGRADTYYKRISEGWDVYGNVRVPRP